MRNPHGLVLPLLLAACAIAPPPASPDALPGAYALSGSLGITDPAHAAFCVSQDLPLTVALPIPDGAAVRPAPGNAAPDFAVTLRRAGTAQPLVAWQVEVAGPAPEPLAERLAHAVADCFTRLDGR